VSDGKLFVNPLHPSVEEVRLNGVKGSEVLGTGSVPVLRKNS
jgi:hypothetical protein